MQVWYFTDFDLEPDVVDVGYDNHMEMVWKWKITPIVTRAPQNATAALFLYGNEQSVS